MTNFTLNIELGNDAMSSAADVAEALHQIAYSLENTSKWDDTDEAHGVRDTNGNKVGDWQVSTLDTGDGTIEEIVDAVIIEGYGTLGTFAFAIDQQPISAHSVRALMTKAATIAMDGAE